MRSDLISMAAVARGLGWGDAAGVPRAWSLLSRFNAVERVGDANSPPPRWFTTPAKLRAALVEARTELVDRIEAIDRFLAMLGGSVNMLRDANAEFDRAAQ